MRDQFYGILPAKTTHELSDAELLAAFIEGSEDGKQTIELACTMLEKLGSLRNIMDAIPQPLGSLFELNDGQLARLRLLPALIARSQVIHPQSAIIISDSRAAYLYVAPKLVNKNREVFAIIFLDTQGRVIAYKELFHGTINYITIYPREIIRAALQYNAAAIIFVHNHPTGLTIPSQRDRQVTRTLIKILAQIEVRVLDHLILGQGGYISMLPLEGDPWPNGGRKSIKN